MYDLILNATNPIPFVMVDTSGVEVAGLGGAVTVTLSKNGGGFGASAGTKAELAGGWYLYTATAGECNTAGPLALRITGAGCVQQNLVYNVGNQDAQLTAIKAKTDTIGALSVTVTAPVAADGAIQIIRGDDYLQTDGRSLSFAITSGPSIAGGTVALRVRVSEAVVEYAGVITGAAACYVQLTTAQTSLLPGSSDYPYDLQATLSNNSIVTLQQGQLSVVGDVR